MNRILISLKCGESLHLVDQEDMSKDQLLEQLSSLFSINSVSILKTKTTSVIIRPSDISSITVEPFEVKQKQVEEKSPPPEDEPDEVQEDIVTDMD